MESYCKIYASEPAACCWLLGCYGFIAKYKDTFQAAFIIQTLATSKLAVPKKPGTGSLLLAFGFVILNYGLKILNFLEKSAWEVEF